MPAYAAVRLLVLVALIGAAALALGSWAVTTRRLSPFGRAARLIRRLSDPVLVPIERAVLRRGGNPRHAPWWLLGAVIVGGIATLTLAQWLITAAITTRVAAGSGGRGLLRVAIDLAGRFLTLALIVRVIGSWVGAGRYNRWMRPVYAVTDWMVVPLRRFIPPIGMFDITPLVALLLVQVAARILVGLVGG